MPSSGWRETAEAGGGPGDGAGAPGPWADPGGVPAIRPASVVVPVPVVGGVAVAVMDVVLVVAVRDGGMAAALAVPVGVVLVRDMGGGLALVPVLGVPPVQMPVVRVVDVVAVPYLGVAAGRSMGVLVRRVFLVNGGHDVHLLLIYGAVCRAGRDATSPVRHGR